MQIFFIFRTCLLIGFRKSITGPILSGHSVTRFDSGLFTLVAGNSVGTVNVTVHVTVECKHYCLKFFLDVLDNNKQCTPEN